MDLSGRPVHLVSSLCMVLVMTSVGDPAYGQTHHPINPNIAIPSSQALIQRALAIQGVSIDTWALMQAYALFDRARLPLQYQSDGKEKCASWVLSGIRRAWDQLTGETRLTLQSYGFTSQGVLSRPTGLDSTRATLHFRIHYSIRPADPNAVPTLDADADGTPDYIDTVETIIEHVWDYEVNTMGFAPPPPDGTSGGDALYDVYVFKLEGGVYGYVQSEAIIGDNPNSTDYTEQYAALSYLALRNDYAGFPISGSMALEVTSAHEFFHSIQNGYNTWEQTWLMESTSAWIEDEVYDLVNDNLQYLPEWFANPEAPLDASNHTADTLIAYPDHWYGSWIFFRYLSEHLPWRSMSILRLWQHSLEHDSHHGDFSFVSIDEMLQEQQFTFPQIFPEFATANLFLTRGPYKYREGNLYPEVSMRTIDGDTTLAFWVWRHGTQYFRVPGSAMPTQCGNSLNISVKALHAGVHSECEYVNMRYGYQTLIPFTESVTIGRDEADSLYIIVMNVDSTGALPSFTITTKHQQRVGQYSITDIGPVNAAGNGARINNRGQVAGAWYASNGTSPRAFLWQNGSVQFLGGIGSTAAALNDSGDVVGWITVSGTNATNAYLWSRGGGRDLDTVGTGRSIAMGINNAGEIAGNILLNVGPSQQRNTPVVWSSAGMRQLGLLSDTLLDGGEALAINSSGEVAGVVNAGGGHGVVWNGTAPTDLGSNFWPNAVNDAGVCVGTMGVVVDMGGLPTGESHASVGGLDIGTIDGLPGFSVASWINNAGSVVGASVNSINRQSAFLYQNGSMTDLNQLIADPSCSWSLDGATGINDSGQIVAYGTTSNDPGVGHAVVLTPISLATVALPLSSRPGEFALEQNYPNPFNPLTVIKYTIGGNRGEGLGVRDVSLIVYDVLGRKVAVLVNERKAPGSYGVKFDAAGLASGVYFYMLTAGNFVQTRKMLLVR